MSTRVGASRSGVLRVVTVVGARPQFIKAAPVSRAIEERGEAIEEILVHTGQHYDPGMSEVFFTQMGIPEPRSNLGVGSHTPSVQTGRMLAALDAELRRLRPDRVLVYGDTSSTLAGALAAAHLDVPVAHVEAGLRSFNRQMSEEINRVLTDHLADLLFCPTTVAVVNLEREGIVDGVHQVGDVMYDCVRIFSKAADAHLDVLDRLEVEPGEYFVATVHRAANTDDPETLAGLTDAICQIGQQLGPVVWPMHPRAEKAVDLERLRQSPGIRITPPLPYLETQCLIRHTRCVLTDSGGMQKEALFHGVPCLTLRSETEWTETVQHGFNRLVGADPSRIVAAAESATFPDSEGQTELYGDGHAAERIVEILLHTSARR